MTLGFQPNQIIRFRNSLYVEPRFRARTENCSMTFAQRMEVKSFFLKSIDVLNSKGGIIFLKQPGYRLVTSDRIVE